MFLVRPMLPQDQPAADDVLRASFATQRSFRRRLERYLDIQPDGFVVAEENGTVIGTAGAIEYVDVAYIGLMGVARAAQGRGVGRALLEALLLALEEKRISCAALDATPAGARLYENAGFVDAGLSHVFVRTGGGPAPAVQDSSPSVVGAIQAEVEALDQRLFGRPRPRLWRRLFAEHPDRIFAARDGGALVGYLCVQETTLGPWGALSEAAANALLDHGLAVTGADSPTVLVPSPNTSAVSLLQRRGWVHERTLRHMRRGADCAGLGWERIHGKGSFCVG